MPTLEGWPGPNPGLPSHSQGNGTWNRYGPISGSLGWTGTLHPGLFFGPAADCLSGHTHQPCSAELKCEYSVLNSQPLTLLQTHIRIKSLLVPRLAFLAPNCVRSVVCIDKWTSHLSQLPFENLAQTPSFCNRNSASTQTLDGLNLAFSRLVSRINTCGRNAVPQNHSTIHVQYSSVCFSYQVSVRPWTEGLEKMEETLFCSCSGQ